MKFPVSRKMLRDESGAIAIEFAVFAIVFILLMGAVVDFGGLAYARFKLESAVSAASNYALVNGGAITAADASTLAGSVASLVASADNSVSGKVVVNNGPEAIIANGSASTTGSASYAANCYCPTNSGESLTWGSAVACNETCASGGRAGKFVEINVKRPYTPLFVFSGSSETREINVRAVVQAK